MQLSKAKLLEKIDEQIKRWSDKAESDHAKAMALYQERLDKWRKDKAPELTTLLRSMANKAGAGKPIGLPNELANNRYNNQARYLLFDEEPPEKREYSHTELDSLKRILDAIEEDSISYNQLKEMGFRNLNSYF